MYKRQLHSSVPALLPFPSLPFPVKRQRSEDPDDLLPGIYGFHPHRSPLLSLIRIHGSLWVSFRCNRRSGQPDWLLPQSVRRNHRVLHIPVPVSYTHLDVYKRQNRSIVENVISFSANARAIQKAMDNGDALDELMIPGIGYYARNDYIMR